MPITTRIVVSIATIAISCAALGTPVSASPLPDARDGRPTLDAAARTSAIDGVLRCLHDGYVYPDLAQKMEQAVRARQAKREYDALTDGYVLADRLTADLRAVSHDLHVRVQYSPDVLPPEPETRFAPSAGEIEQMRPILARENFGLARAEVLPGNVGYLDFRYFADPLLAGDTYAAAMAFIAHTEALIIDLRQSNGSISEEALPWLLTYLFPKPVHLNDIYWRSRDKRVEYWTKESVPGRRYLDKPVYVLTSGHTFSGAEELAYDLKNLKRATLVGDATGGGANPGGDRRADDHFVVWVPNGRAISPITGTNWEGVGVAPDVAVPATRALNLAHRLTLKKLLADGPSDNDRQAALRNALADLDAREKAGPRTKRVTFTLKGYPDAKEVVVAGTFNYWALRTNRMTRRWDTWVAEVEVEPGRRHEYKFVVDGRWLTDPANPHRAQDSPTANSVLTVEEGRRDSRG